MKLEQRQDSPESLGRDDSSSRSTVCSADATQETRMVPDEDTNQLRNHFLEKQQNNSKLRKRKEIIKIRTKVNELENIKKIQRIYETKSQFFQKINKNDKPLAKLTKRKREKPKLIKLEIKKEITTNISDIQQIIRDYFRNLYSNKLENLQGMDTSLDKYMPKLN